MTDKTVHLLTKGDDHVHCCGRLVAEVYASGEQATLNPHGTNCKPRTLMAKPGDPVPSPKAVVASNQLIAHLVAEGINRPQNVRGEPDGTIQLEWHQDGVDIEVYVEIDGSVDFWADCPRILSGTSGKFCAEPKRQRDAPPSQLDLGAPWAASLAGALHGSSRAR